MVETKTKQVYDWRETGRAVKFYRRALQLTQSEVSKRIGGGSNSIISNWEKGLREPRLSNFVAVAQALGVSEMDLLHPSEEVMRGMDMSKP